MNRLVRLAAVAALGIVAAGTASAHHIWLEVDGDGARLYFGEFGENLREASPGSLDRLQPQAHLSTAAGAQPLAIDRKPQAFALGGPIPAGASVIAEDTRYPVSERKRDGATTRSIYQPAARYVPDRAPRAPVLTLDVVPIDGGRFRVLFKDKPLAKAKVEVITPSGWGRELHAGEDGSFAVDLPWRGLYVLEVQHADRTPGKRGDDAYDVVNYVTSLSVVQPSGLEPLPPPPPAKPH